MKGIVLCGGQSTRMGKDKATLLHQSDYWAALAAGKLAPLTSEVLLSVNRQQVALYQPLFSYRLITDNNQLQVKGPLKGILSAHLACPYDDLFVLACDMIQMELLPLAQLAGCFLLKPSPAMVYTREEKTEPLCGIYTSRALRQLHRLHMKEGSNNYSMHDALLQIQSAVIPLPEQWNAYFANMNCVADIAADYRYQAAKNTPLR